MIAELSPVPIQILMETAHDEGIRAYLDQLPRSSPYPVSLEAGAWLCGWDDAAELAKWPELIGWEYEG